MIQSKLNLLLILISLSVLLVTCDQKSTPQDEEDDLVINQDTSLLNQNYLAGIDALNENVRPDTADGNVEIMIEGDEVIINVNMRNLEPGMMHLQHLHGKKDLSESMCPAGSDDNNDGVIDVAEATNYAGTIMIPLHSNPTSLDISSESYPVADEEGNLSYSKTFMLEDLRQAIKENYNQADLDFSRFTYIIHGIDSTAKVPESAQSINDLPVYMTLPIGCGEVNQEIEFGD